jgi:phosphate transport system substrate-binding protein
MVSRELSPEEKSQGLEGTVIGFDGIAVIANAANPVKAFSKDQLRDLFSGKIRSWQEVGGKNASIEICGPNRDHGTFSAFTEILQLVEEKTGADGKKMKKDLIPETYSGFQSHNATIAYVIEHPNALGFIPVGFLESGANASLHIKGVEVDGIAPKAINVANHSYPIIRPLQIVHKGPLAAGAADFVKFLLSPSGNAILEKLNYVAPRK